MRYFAYGSNMCTGRLRQRVPSARALGIGKLVNHAFRFHKRSQKDGSAKGDAFYTGDPADVVWGVIFELDPRQKLDLERHEGIENGYTEKPATVDDRDGNNHQLFMYVAEPSHTDPMLRPYSWYKRFVVEGARQHGLPADYIAGLEAMLATEDPNRERDARNRQITC